MRGYGDRIREIDATVNAVGVECVMRLQYGTLDHLDTGTFRIEVEVARAMEEAEPGCLRSLAGSYGREAEFDQAQELADRAAWSADADVEHEAHKAALRKRLREGI